MWVTVAVVIERLVYGVSDALSSLFVFPSADADGCDVRGVVAGPGAWPGAPAGDAINARSKTA